MQLLMHNQSCIVSCMPVVGCCNLPVSLALEIPWQTDILEHVYALYTDTKNQTGTDTRKHK